MQVALATLIAAQFFDFGTFVEMVRRFGSVAEANPLAAMLLDTHGVGFLFVAKLVAVALVFAVVAVLVAPNLSRPRTRVAGAVVGIGIVVGLIGGVSNALVLL